MGCVAIERKGPPRCKMPSKDGWQKGGSNSIAFLRKMRRADKNLIDYEKGLFRVVNQRQKQHDTGITNAH